MMNKLRSFMEGRYGYDQLSLCLVIIGCIITFILSFIRFPLYRCIGLIPMVLAFLRILSKNREKRYIENQKFLNIWLPISRKMKMKFDQLKDREHKYYKCPTCKKTLRVPSNRGKIEISCPHCGTKFKKRT